MAVSVRHRRASEEEWLEHDPIIPDGEIALTKSSTGYNIKVGDGQSKYSELTAVKPKISSYFGEEYILEVNIEPGSDTRLGCMEDLTVTINRTLPEDFYAILSFYSDEFVTMLTLPSDPYIYFTGTDVIEGVLVPQQFTHYTLFFWYDGGLQCNVRGHKYV